MDATPEDVPRQASKTDLRPALNVVGELVALGPLRRDLIPAYQRWINDFQTTRTLAVAPRPVTQEQETHWYEEAVTSEHDVSFTVYERATLHPVGVSSLTGIDFYAFTTLGLHSVRVRPQAAVPHDGREVVG
jgi:RimJ/RimL family protein N-acetyltransferase